MKATYVKTGETFQPAIKTDRHHVEVLYGPPLGTAKRAKFYAQCEINERRQAQQRKFGNH